MKVFRIYAIGLYSQAHCVVAESYDIAYKLWKESGGSEPNKIELVSEYVIIQDNKESSL